MFNWRKAGLILKAEDVGGQAASHAQTPTPLVMDDCIRVYFAARVQAGRSFTAFVDLALDDPGRILRICPDPVIPGGNPGTFDDEGIMPSTIVRDGDRILLYYSGWNQRITVPYHNSTGLAFSQDGGKTFSRMYEGPVLDRTPDEPYLAVTPSVLREGDIWRIWYVSGLRWEKIAGRFEPIYVIKNATSADGVRWNRPNRVCIPQQHDLEAFSRPWVLRLADGYHMWYCYRHSIDYRDGTGSYRIGYATSADGDNWSRRDAEAGINVSESGWDSTMICYPSVIQVKNELLMFYNGNSFGHGGFGYARATIGAEQ